ncbi:MAG: hypothetical protein WA842_08425 [Croceibacterium sp.]
MARAGWVWLAVVPALIGALIGALAATSGQARTWKVTDPLRAGKPLVVQSEGVSVTLSPPTAAQREAYDQLDEAQAEDEEAASEAEGDEDIGPPPPATITVSFPGQPPFAVPVDETRLDAHGISVGIGALRRGDAPVVILEGYSGGMHCCATFQTVALADGRPTLLPLPGLDGAPDRRFPRDANGDGTVDIIRADDRFLYAFTSYNASWAPPVVYNLRGGQLVDVSAEPAFAPAFIRFVKDTGKICGGTDAGRNGACSAYAAALARLGRAEEGIAFAVAHQEDSNWLPEPCTVDLLEDYTCPEGKARTFSGFEEALRWFLQDAGYTR